MRHAKETTAVPRANYARNKANSIMTEPSAQSAFVSSSEYTNH
jgi:hypothetical protein